jgi:hypothetical protein
MPQPGSARAVPDGAIRTSRCPPLAFARNGTYRMLRRRPGRAVSGAQIRTLGGCERERHRPAATGRPRAGGPRVTGRANSDIASRAFEHTVAGESGAGPPMSATNVHLDETAPTVKTNHRTAPAPRAPSEPICVPLQRNPDRTIAERPSALGSRTSVPPGWRSVQGLGGRRLRRRPCGRRFHRVGPDHGPNDGRPVTLGFQIGTTDSGSQ